MKSQVMPYLIFIATTIITVIICGALLQSLPFSGLKQKFQHSGEKIAKKPKGRMVVQIVRVALVVAIVFCFPVAKHPIPQGIVVGIISIVSEAMLPKNAIAQKEE